MSFFAYDISLATEKIAQMPGKATIDNWTCKEIAELGEKYGAEKKLPAAVLSEGVTCPRNEVAVCLLSIIDKVLEKCGKEGPEAVTREDLDRIAKLHEALKTELAGMEGYLTKRKEIEEILAKPEEPPFLYRIGAKGFVRGEGTGNLRLTDFSYIPDHGEGRFLYRVKPYVYWHPTDYLDLHLEGQGYGFTGGSQYSGRYSLYQGFVEAKLPEKNQMSLKLGRQEFSYGSTFILGSNSFYDGLVFDAMRLRLQPAGPLNIDLLVGYYASPFATGLKGNLAGIYTTYRFSEDNNIEAYGFRDTGSPEGGSVNATEKLVFNATGHYFLANEVENDFSRGIGLETDFNFTYTINYNLSLIVAYDHFFTGGFFRDSSGSRDDINYGYVMLQFDLDKTRARARKYVEK